MTPIRHLLILLLCCSPLRAQPLGPPDPMAANTWTSLDEIKRSPFGVGLVPDVVAPPLTAATARSSVRGTGISTTNDGRIRGQIVEQCYIGAKLGSSDSRIIDTDLFGCRDACLWVAASTGSANCVSTADHYYGGRIACYNEGSQDFRSVNDTFADALVGYFGDYKVAGSDNATITNALFQHNLLIDCLPTSTNCHLLNCTVRVQMASDQSVGIPVPEVLNGDRVFGFDRIRKTGVALCSRCSIVGGSVILDTFCHPNFKPLNKPCDAVWVQPNSDGAVINTQFIDNQKIDGATAVRIDKNCHRIRIDSMVDGFTLPNERLLVIEDPTHTDGLDVTFRVSGPAKPIGNYIKTGPGWSGSIRVVGSDKTVVLAQGKAA